MPVKLYMGTVAPNSITTHTTCMEFLKAVDSGQLSAVVGIASTPRDNWLERLAAQGVPVVGDPDRYPSGVSFRKEQIITLGIETLLAGGCRRPVLIQLDAPYHQGRTDAFAHRVHQAGLSFDPSRQVRSISSGQAGAAWEAVRDLWRSGQRPDGLLIADDTFLKDAAIALLELRVRIPEEIKIASHISLEEPLFFPFPFTGIGTNSEDLASAAFLMVQALLNGKPLTEPHQYIPLSISEYTPPLYPQSTAIGNLSS